MPELSLQRFKPAPNIDILNALRGVMTNDYHHRIPEATQANLQDTINKLMTNVPSRNEFVAALINKVGLTIARTNSWENPLARFKIGMLNFGDTIEEIQTGLARAYVYDTDREALEGIIFGTEVPEVQASYHKINRQNFYKISVNEAMLRRAFTDEYGLSNLITQLMGSITTSDNVDEFLLMTQLFAEYERNNGFFKINVPDIAALDSTTAEAKQGLRKIRAAAGNLTFVSRNYNAAKMPVATTVDKLVMFCTPEFAAAVDVEALAPAFNIDKADVPTKWILIPQERFGIPGAQAIITTEDFFVVADTYFDTKNIENPATTVQNYFLHHHQIISASRFVPAILFTTEPGSVLELEETPVASIADIVVKNAVGTDVATLARGAYHSVVVNGVTNPVGGENDAVVLSITGQKSPFTYITQTGALFVHLTDDAAAISITAVAVDDNTKAKTRVLNVTGETEGIWPAPENPAPEEEGGGA